MERRLKDWLSGYLLYCANSEPQQSYHIWTGLSMLAGALERRVYMHWEGKNLYPNLYVILVGPSGWARKGTAMNMGKPLIKNIGAKVIEGAITREKLIRRMCESFTAMPDEKIGAAGQCAITYVSNELVVFLGQNNIKLLGDLCDWYDCPDVWPYDTKNQGTDIIEGICVNILGGVAPDWIPEILPPAAIGGGFTSRCVWVVEEDKRATVPYPKVDKQLGRALQEDLQRIYVDLVGEMKFDEETYDYYGEWYQAEDDKIRDGNPPIHDPKFTSYCSRRGTLIKKLCMLISASEGSDRIINMRHFSRAVDILTKTELKMPRAFSGLGLSRYAAASEMLLNFLVQHKQATKTQILKFFFRDIDEWTFKVIIRTLEGAGIVDVTYMTDPPETIVKIKDTGCLYK